MKVIKKLRSTDGIATKFLQKTSDNNVIETSYFNLKKHIVCLSCQIGCPMGCIFCATSFNLPKRFIRNLTAEEIVKEVKNVLKVIKKEQFNKKPILISFHGMGEPFLNYRNVIKSIKVLANYYPDSEFGISTLGSDLNNLKKLASEGLEQKLEIHFSLHAPNDSLRLKILPRAQKIVPILEAIEAFTNNMQISVKVVYLLIKDLNDLKKQAIQLAELLKGYPFVDKLRLSYLNRFNDLEPSEEKNFSMFEKILNSEGIKTYRFRSDGQDIKAGCGQLIRRELLNKNSQCARDRI